MKYSNLFKGAGIGVLIAVVFLFSCDKNLNKTNPNAPTVQSFFKTSAQLLSGTNAIYTTFHSSELVSREWFFVQDLRSDDMAAGGGQLEVPRAQMLNGANTADNAVMNSVWNGLYTVIHRSNTVIDNGPVVTDNNALRDNCVAQAKFFRAWSRSMSRKCPLPISSNPGRPRPPSMPRSSRI
jgi:hypothetical protein